MKKPISYKAGPFQNYKEEGMFSKFKEFNGLTDKELRHGEVVTGLVEEQGIEVPVRGAIRLHSSD